MFYLIAVLTDTFPSDSIFIIISPFKSVLYIFVPICFNLFSTSASGCPKLFFCPTPINDILGLTLFINSCVLDVDEPWCPTFNTSAPNNFIFILI